MVYSDCSKYSRRRMGMRSSEQINELSKALAAAQAEFPSFAKNKTAKVRMRQEKGGGEYTFGYANLHTIIDAVRGPLTKHDLAIVQVLDADENGIAFLRTRVLHSSGQWLESSWQLRVQGTPQERGSEITYARRYTLCALLCIAADEDDDGNTASGNSATLQDRKPAKTTPRTRATAAQARDLRALMEQANLAENSKKVKEWLTKAKVRRIEDLKSDTIKAITQVVKALADKATNDLVTENAIDAGAY